MLNISLTHAQAQVEPATIVWVHFSIGRTNKSPMYGADNQGHRFNTHAVPLGSLGAVVAWPAWYREGGFQKSLKMCWFQQSWLGPDLLFLVLTPLPLCLYVLVLFVSLCSNRCVNNNKNSPTGS